MAQPNYELEARKKQEEQDRAKYQQQRNPFQIGQEVARRRYSEIMSGLDARQRESARSYSDMYQAARESAVRDRAMGGPTLSGGMGQQYSDLLSTREIQALGQIGAQRESAAREIDLQRQSAFANAELEGQQRTQIELEQQQTQLQLIQQKNQLLADKDLTNEQKAEQLRALGYNQEATDVLNEEEKTPGPSVLSSILGAVGIGAGAATLFAGGAGFKAALATVGVVGFKFILPILAIAYGVEKLILENAGVNDGAGLIPEI